VIRTERDWRGTRNGSLPGGSAQFAPGDSALYESLLAPLDGVTDVISKEGGGWERLGPTVGLRDGHWTTVPWFYISFPLAWRTDLFEEVGEKLPDTWDDLLRAGKKLKAKGHPLGLQFGHSNDANNLERTIMWSFGASEVGKDSKTITVDSNEMLTALEFAKRLHVEANDPTTIVWDDASNNRCLAAAKCPAILNPISAWASIDKQGIRVPGKQTPLAQVINHDLPPAGPAGRFSAAAVLLARVRLADGLEDHHGRGRVGAGARRHLLLGIPDGGRARRRRAHVLAYVFFLDCYVSGLTAGAVKG
jgi:ABC-type glycerol-3-phosphate transport system substrate-binding protein